MDEHQHLSIIHLVLHHQQSAMRTYHHGVACFAEFAAIVRAAFGLHARFVKYASTSPAVRNDCFAHTAILGPGFPGRQLIVRLCF